MKQTILKYLIECVFIFVGVISAFLVDNVRDRNLQKEQELDLLRNVTTDLIKDTTLIQKRIEFGILLSNELTQLVSILDHPERQDTADDYALKYSTGLFLNKTTYEGIKNTGGFKFINDKKLVSELSDYYNNREEWTQYSTDEIEKIDTEIATYLRTQTKFIDHPVNGPVGSVISYNIDAKSLRKMRGDQRIINLCYEKRTHVQQMTWLMDSLKMASKYLNKKCSAYVQNEN